VAAPEHDHVGAYATGSEPGRRHLILWDGECGFCRDSIDWVMAHDRRGVLAELPYQDVPDPPMTPELREACGRAVHVITADGRLLRAGQASLFVLEQLGWRRLAAIARVPPLLWLVEAAYRVVASHRPLMSRLVRRLTAHDARSDAAEPRTAHRHH
jgi:predicted DCC family thiol-disulfide oxidoreductase YuxK